MSTSNSTTIQQNTQLSKTNIYSPAGQLIATYYSSEADFLEQVAVAADLVQVASAAQPIGCLGSGRVADRLQPCLYGCPFCNATFGQAEIGNTTWPEVPAYQAR